MATIDLGRLGFVNKGTYNNSTTYEKNDLVQFTDGGILSTYLYIDSSAQSGQAPSSSGTAGSRWVYFAKGGAAGTDVGTTLTTQGDILYRDGSGLQRLAAGTNGQALLTGGAGANPSWGTISGASNAFLAEGMSGGASGTLVFNNEIFDNGGNYNHTNGKYIAPSNGIYLFHFHALSSGSATDMVIRINNNNVGGLGSNWGYTRDGGDPDGVTVIYSLSQNDEITCVAISNNVYNNYCWFTGVKLY